MREGPLLQAPAAQKAPLGHTVAMCGVPCWEPCPGALSHTGGRRFIAQDQYAHSSSRRWWTLEERWMV
jgi:hypothetical protein